MSMDNKNQINERAFSVFRSSYERYSAAHKLFEGRSEKEKKEIAEQLHYIDDKSSVEIEETPRLSSSPKFA